MDPDIPPAVHRTVLVVDVERFSDHSRTNPHRLTVREALYRILRSGFAKAGIGWADCHHEDRGDGVLVLVPPEVAKSLFVEHLPGEFTRLLDEHNAAHGPGEQIRLRMAVHAGEIYYDAHGVVGQAVNLAYRLIDSPVLKAVLTESANALALIASKWFYEEVVLHSMTVDARSYRPVRVHVKETDTTAWIRVADGGGDHRPQPYGPQWTASDESARRLGARRTAYPLDLSIAELHTRGLYVPATFSNLTRDAESASVEDIVTEVEAGSSVLILGEPGSGKSVACYALLRRLRKHTPAIAVRMTELRRVLDGFAVNAPLAAALYGEHPRSVLVIDGLDETLGEFGSAADLSELLHQLSENFVIVVTCRRREFEDNLAHSMESGAFHRIVAIDPWTFDGQFTEFVTRLITAGLLDGPALLEMIERSPGLAMMVTRPLYARMLTFLGKDKLPAVTDVSSLYGEYIDALATASDASLVRAGCRLPVTSHEIWIEAAWQIYAQGMLHEDRFGFDSVVALVAERTGASERCLARALSQVCDQWRVAGRVWGRFVHYSFFEYLVSCHYVRGLRRATTTAALIECLSPDPSPEIRHFAVDELRMAPVPRLADALEQAYLQLRASDAELSRIRTTGNLIAYLLSHAVHGGQAKLRRLAGQETDIFLLQSLLWGLCRLGDEEALTRFVRELRASAEWRAWNRGYLMYYYGDIDRRTDPPYVDTDRDRGWSRTRERSIDLMSAIGYLDEMPAQRRYLDLYVLYDYAVWRGELLSGAAARVARDSLAALWADRRVEGSLLLELQAMHAVVCPQ